MKYIRIILVLTIVLCSNVLHAAEPREKTLINNAWAFAYGSVSDLTTSHSSSPSSPAAPGFNDSSWQTVSLPHDWAADLPYASEALSTNGFKAFGYMYPNVSVGWYRKHLNFRKEDEGSRFALEFEGICRDAQVFFNGMFLGSEKDGYSSAFFDITEYVNFDGDNVIAVRADASLCEAGYYEGAGIYRNVYLHRTSDVSVNPHGVSVREYLLSDDASSCIIVSDVSLDTVSGGEGIMVAQTLLDSDGRQVATVFSNVGESIRLEMRNPVLWSPENRYLYTLRTCVYRNNLGIENLLDQYDIELGIRTVSFDEGRGLVLNGKAFDINACNVYPDHAGVGTAIPDGLWRYRIAQLQKHGINTIRTAHGPASPALLDICDEMGMMVIDENHQMGISTGQLSMVRNMVERDMNHPSVIMWCIGDNEQVFDNTSSEKAVAARLSAFIRSLDSTRPVVYGSDADNLMSGSVDAIAIDRNPDEMGGLHAPGGSFYCWNGFDHRGSSDLNWPQTISGTGLFDWCGQAKPQAFHAWALFSREPVVHIVPDWNAAGKQGYVDVCVYSNCDEVQLSLNGMPLGKRTVSQDGSASWQVKYRSGKLEAKGFRNGKRVASHAVETSGYSQRIAADISKTSMIPDGQDISVIDLTVTDTKGRVVPDAAVPLNIKVSDNISILGWGNADPEFKLMERPLAGSRDTFTVQTYGGRAQLIVRSVENAKGTAYIAIDGLEFKTITLNY